MKKFITAMMVAAFLVGSVPQYNFAQSKRPGGSSSGSSSGSAKPSIRPSSPSTPSQRPSAPPPSSTPPSNSTPSQRPSSPSTPTPSVRPNANQGSDQKSTPATPPNNSSSATASPSQQPQSQSDSNKPSPSVRPGSGSSAPPSNGNSVKPSNDSNYNGAAVANKKSDESKAQFVKANAPKADFKTPTGQTVKIDPNSEDTKRVRNLPPESVDPVHRKEIVEKHYYHYYGSRYDYYRSQPPIYIGYYRPEFWYSTYDWDTHRQALWLYNNQSLINSDLWNQRMQNAAVRAEINQMQMQNMAHNSSYVDPEFANDPVAMYSDQYVDAAYNGQPVVASGSFGKWLCIIMSSMILLGLVLYFVFVHEWTQE